MAEPNPKKIKFETKKELLDMVVDDITCVQCKIVPREAPIYHTDGGKILCFPCSKTWKQPPKYREVVTKALEKLLFELPRPCKFKKNGCQVTLDLKNIEYHEEDCIYRDILCFYNDCQNVFVFEDFPEHVKSKHHCDLSALPKRIIKDSEMFCCRFNVDGLRKEKVFTTSKPFYFEECDKKFFVCQQNGFIWLMIYGSQFEAKNFKYSMECEDPEFGTFCYKNYVKSLDDKKTDIIKSEKCLRIPLDLYWKYFGKHFEINITIENLKKEEPEFDEEEFENPSNETQPLKEIIEKALKKTFVKDDTWFLVESEWFGQLKKHLGLDKPEGAEGSTNARPGPIDNGPLFKENAVEKEEIKDGLIEWLEYVPVPEEAWKALVKEFGLREGQPPISRKVIEPGKIAKHCKIEIYFMTFQLADSAQPDETVKKKFSKTVSLLTIQKTMKEVFQIPDNTQTRLWIKYPEKAYELLSNLDTTAQDSSLYHDQVIMIERQKSDGSWPCKNEK